MSASATQGGHNNTNIMLGTYSQKGERCRELLNGTTGSGRWDRLSK